MAKILFTSPISTPGGPIYILEKLLKNISLEHDVAVVAPGNGELFETLDDMQLPAYHTGPNGLNSRAIPWLCKLILNQKFNLVYGSSYRSATRNSLIAAKMTGRPFIWHINEMVKGKEAKQWDRAFFLRYADVIIGDSEACVEAIKQHVPNQEVQLVYNGVELEEFQEDITEARRYVREILDAPPNHTVVLNAGLICERKGQLQAVQAAIEVMKRNPLVTFAFLGEQHYEPEYFSTLENLVREANLTEQIVFLGFRSDFPKLLAGSDIFLHTAKVDPHPVVVLSAMGAKKPVVAFDIEGVAEQIVNGETGLLVPFSNISSLADALIKCINDPPSCVQMGQAGQKRVQELFTADKMASQVKHLINGLV